MANHYGLDFTFDDIPCQLVHIQQGKMPAKRNIPYYHHQHLYYEFHYIEFGSADFLCHNQPIRLEGGQLLIVPPGLYHSITWQSEEIKQISLSISMAPKHKKKETVSRFFSALPKDNVVILSVSHSDLQDTLQRFSLLANAPDGYLTREKLRALCPMFFINLYELLVDREVTPLSPKEKSPLSQDYLLDNFFSSQFIAHSSFQDLAKQLHISQRQLHRIIQKKYHMNYREKSKETRIEIATDLLCHSNKTISEIAEFLGYSKTTNFSCFIKSVTGKTPSQIRKENHWE